jgi:hypothetical protein
MIYKHLVLASLIVLSTFTIVTAATHDSMEFFGNFLGTVQTKYKSGFYVWGVVNRAPLAQVEMNKEETYLGIKADMTCWQLNQYDCAQHECVWDSDHCSIYKPGYLTLNEGTYFASGWIKFNKDIPIGQSTPVVDFEIELAKTDPSYWDYQIINRKIIQSESYTFFATRESKNTYTITCNMDIKTIERLSAPSTPYSSVEAEIPWSFTATINV